MPMLHKFNYVPIAQPILAGDVVRFVGEPIAAVVAPSREAAEDIAEGVTVTIEVDSNAAHPMRWSALAADAPHVHAGAPGNVIVEGHVRTASFDATSDAAHRRVKVEIRSRRQNASPMEPRAAHAAYDPADERITLTCATQMPHLVRTANCRRDPACLDPVFASSPLMSAAASARRCRSARNSFSSTYSARPQAAHVGGLDRGPARKLDGVLSQP